MANSTATPQPVALSDGMDVLDLVKSSVVLFLAKTCKLFLLFGCLWITLCMQNPQATQWAGGVINSVLLAIMGFAVDAAMPEAFI